MQKGKIQMHTVADRSREEIQRGWELGRSSEFFSLAGGVLQ